MLRGEPGIGKSRLLSETVREARERGMLAVREPWRPYRSLAVSYLFASEFENGT